ncbi:predicted protein [Nematostella vectensis]|uniref:DED domain-containing protein n=1 Tax=Nematostella vectensis TaxID=45351 RepID=A7SWS8_NEMVE|nr:predicted protein [Nematostella vectensis]|eukprot:XP_001623934.1 predicted protein [Nematostella vectensis]
MEEPVSKYRVFLLQLAQQLTDEDCRGMKFLAADFIPRAKRDTIEGVLEFFCELEDCKRMNADNLDILKFLLMQLKHFALVKKVEEFELERRVFAQSLLDIRKKQSCNQDPNNNTIAKNSLEGDSSHGTHSHESRKHGELSARVVLELAGRGAWYLGCGYILNRYKDDPDTLAHLVTTVVLPTGILMKTLSKGSITIVFQANDLDALREFWKRYRDGTLRDALYRVLVTEELVQLAAKRTFVFKVEMDETEYRDALLDLLVVKLQANGLLKTIASSRSRRRSKSLPDLASLVLNSSRECPRDIHVTLASELKKRNSELWDILLKFGNRRITHELKREPATPRITFTSGVPSDILITKRILDGLPVCFTKKIKMADESRGEKCLPKRNAFLTSRRMTGRMKKILMLISRLTIQICRDKLIPKRVPSDILITKRILVGLPVCFTKKIKMADESRGEKPVLEFSSRCRGAIGRVPMVAYRKPRSLKDMLVHSSFKEDSTQVRGCGIFLVSFKLSSMWYFDNHSYEGQE